MSTKVKIHLFLSFLLIVFANFAILLAQNDKKEEKTNEGNISDFYGAFKIKNWDKDLKTPEVKDEGKNVLREPYHSDEIAKIADSNGLAAKIALKEKIKWRPLWRYEKVGTILIPSICISSDKSLLAIVETTGEPSGPNGSRIIIMRTADWLILRVHELKQKKIQKALFVKDSTELILSALRQQEIKEYNELILMNAESAEVLKSKKFKNKIKNFIVLEENIVVCLEADIQKGGSEIYEIEKNSLQMGKKYQSSNDDGLILAIDHESSEKFIFAGNKSIEIFSENTAEPIAKFANVENMTSSAAISLEMGTLVAAVYPSGTAYIIREQGHRKLLEAADSILFFDRNSASLVLCSIKKDNVVFFKKPGFEQSESFSVSSLKPKTGGDIVFLDAIETNSYLFVDSHGNFFKCYKTGKKWRKELALEPMR